MFKTKAPIERVLAGSGFEQELEAIALAEFIKRPQADHQIGARAE
jgi:hypothetical protein